MTIEAQLPDGTALQFPDGTPDAVVQGAVKQQLSKQPNAASQTPESKLGLTPAAAEPPPPPDPRFTAEPASGDQGGMGGSAMPAAGQTPSTPPDPVIPGPRHLDAPSFEFHPFAAPKPGALGRVGQAAAEGWRGGQVVSPNLIMAPVYNSLMGGLGAVFRGSQQFAQEAIDPILPGLGRDIAAFPEAFPTGHEFLPDVPQPGVTRPQFLPGESNPVLPRGKPSPPPDAPPGPAQTAEVYPPPPPPLDPRGVPIRDFGQPVRPLGELPPNAMAPQTTGLQNLGQAGQAMGDNLRDMLWDKLQKGDTTELGRPSQILTDAKAAMDQGAIKTRADFDAWSQQWGAQRRTAGQTGTPAPTPTSGEPTPQPAPAGAQITPAAQSALTPEQEAAAGSTADKQWYYKTIVPGEANRIQYIDGINPTMAQQELTVNAARDSKNLRRLSEDADQNERALLAQHSEIRKNEFQNIAGSDTTQQTALKAANDQIEAQLQAAYAHGGTVDLQPVLDAANKELTGSAGKLPPLKAAMKEIADAAQKSDGSGLETNPLQANAVRRAIIYMQSREGRQANPGYGSPDVMAALTRVKDVLTKQIEPAAPGFTKANADYAAARQAIDAREALQAYEPKLYTGPMGNMTFAPMHRLMGEVIAGRDPKAPLNPYKALTDDQMNRLKSLHDDLQRVASAQELANAAGGGSDTGQTLFDMAKKAARTGLSTAGGAGTGFAVGHIFGHEAGMAAGMFTKTALDNLFSQRAVAQATAEHNRLLRPDLAQYPLKPNPFMQPPSAP